MRTLREILRESSKIYGLTQRVIKSKSREVECIHARVFVIKNALVEGYSPKQLAEFLNMDRTAIYHSMKIDISKPFIADNIVKRFEEELKIVRSSYASYGGKMSPSPVAMTKADKHDFEYAFGKAS